MNKLTEIFRLVLLLVALQLSACSMLTEVDDGPRQAEILTIFPDGSMRLMGRLVPEEDVFIYADGYGGEKAAIKVRLEPLHPAFYRDSIIVRRLETGKVADN